MPALLRPLSLFTLGLVATLAGCAKESSAAAAQNDPLKAPVGLDGKATLVPSPDNPLTLAKVELGKALFFEPRLSGSGNMSCSTCHQHKLGWTDGKDFSVKDDGSKNTRNTPSMYNVGYLEKLYWDGRAPSLEKNVRAAWEKQMFGKPDEVAKKLGDSAGYKDLFQKAFAGEPTADRISMALASFLRTLQSGNSPFDREAAGEQNALNADAAAGRQLFQDKGCNNCHQMPLFTDRIFHNTGIGMAAEKPDVGAGGDKALNDPKLKGAFKTPSLRSVAKTAPYFHDASAATLADAVRVMGGGGKDAKDNTRDPLLKDQKLTDVEVRQLVAFLESLSSSESFTPPTLPK